MKEIIVKTSIKLYQQDELSGEDVQLLNSAKRATNNAYAIYSNFHVGAAVLLENGNIVIGANQENAAYPSGLCAERTAVFSAQAQYPDQPIKALAIAARNENGFMPTPTAPCGACRQVILEIEDRYKCPIRILLYGTEGIYVVDSIKDLLPLSFVNDSMK